MLKQHGHVGSEKTEQASLFSLRCLYYENWLRDSGRWNHCSIVVTVIADHRETSPPRQKNPSALSNGMQARSCNVQIFHIILLNLKLWKLHSDILTIISPQVASFWGRCGKLSLPYYISSCLEASHSCVLGGGSDEYFIKHYHIKNKT